MNDIKDDTKENRINDEKVDVFMYTLNDKIVNKIYYIKVNILNDINEE